MIGAVRSSARVFNSAKLPLSISSRFASTYRDSDVVILSAVRTPVGSNGGSLATVSAIDLGATVVREAIARANIPSSKVSEVLFGNVVGAGLGQAPATQVAMKSGIPDSVPSTTVNKVCSSGLKTVMLGAQSIQTGHSEVVVAGGMESMSNIPHYLLKARSGYGMGHGQLVDGLLRDGLSDPNNDQHMGMCSEWCAEEFKVSREAQDAYALESYRLAQQSMKAGLFKAEIVSVKYKNKKGEEIVVSEDEEPGRLQADKMLKLKPAFKPTGTATAANSSKVNDGASAIIVASGAFARANGLKPLAKILSFADAQRKPIEFPIAPALAIPKALKLANLEVKDVDYFEINEAFSTVPIANMKILGIQQSKMNVNGGAVAMGHAIGSSGARILVTLVHILKQKKAKTGVAAICNGQGGSSCVVIENLD